MISFFLDNGRYLTITRLYSYSEYVFNHIHDFASRYNGVVTGDVIKFDNEADTMKFLLRLSAYHSILIN